MLVICEDCAAKYNIEESKIKSDRARFSCRKCGHIIVVEKNDLSSSPANPSDRASQQDNPGKNSAKNKEKKGKQNRKSSGGLSIKFYLILIPAIVFLSMTSAFTFVYFKYIPQLMNEQIDLRVSSISTMFSGTIQKPLLVRNYLQVNKEAERVANLPGVAYAAVVNEKGFVVAGFFGDLDRFESVFADRVKTAGFPKEIIENNKLTENALNKNARFTLGGQEIMDRTEKLTETGGVVHVGLYLSDFDESIQKALFSPLAIALISVIFLGGLLSFLAIARCIGVPLIQLTNIVNRISLGELDLTITPHGPKEVRELGRACERMRYSVKNAIERLRKNR